MQAIDALPVPRRLEVWFGTWSLKDIVAHLATWQDAAALGLEQIARGELLQAVAYDLGMLTPRFDHFFPDRPVDASHPEILLDFNRCILCELCIRASSEVDGKNVFALSGRGIRKHLIVNAESGRLADTDIATTDKAMEVCPVGVILRKRVGFAVPIGQRQYDARPVSAQALEYAPRAPSKKPGDRG